MMNKKVVDISPPGKPKEEKIKISPPLKREPIFRFKTIKPKKAWLILLPLFLIAVTFAVLSNLSRAEIEIWPETEVKTFRTKLTVDKAVTTYSFLNKVIPGKIFETEKTVSQEFSSSGKFLKEKKAEGIIRIYNNHSSLPQTLVVNTRFQPPLEKFQPALEKGENPWFRSVERIVIPAKGYTDVKVVADSPGEKYNIEPATFSIPGLAGTPQYTFVYGKSSEPMKGGVKKETPKITQEDLDRAKNEISKKAEEECRESLKNKIPADFDFLEAASKTEILETFSLAKPEAELEKFTYQVKVHSLTLVFKTEDLKNFVNALLSSEIPTGKIIHQESLKINYSLGNVDLAQGILSLSTDIETKIYSDIEEVSLKRALERKSLAEAKIFLENQPQITKAQIRPWPFWVEKIPATSKQIKITLNVD